MIIIERGRDNKCSNVENLHLNVKLIEHSNECLTFVYALQQRCLDNGGSTVLPFACILAIYLFIYLHKNNIVHMYT